MGDWIPKEDNLWESKPRLETAGNTTIPETGGTHERNDVMRALKLVLYSKD